jgi:hypothetical protein
MAVRVTKKFHNLFRILLRSASKHHPQTLTHNQKFAEGEPEKVRATKYWNELRLT